MCQYAAIDGHATDWHLMHWGNLLNSGAALFTIEATAVVPDGRITPACLGLWDDATEGALADNLERARKLAPHTAVCIQLAHAGRKASSALPWAGAQLLPKDQGGWQPVGPSAVSYKANELPPREMSIADMDGVREAFVNAARRADRMGIEAVEIHNAHGYLLHEFLSPLSNQRGDHYGGSFENRIRYPLEVFAAVRAAFSGVLGLRISASDWVEGGWDGDQSAEFTKRLRTLGCDFIHVSSGGNSPLQKIAAMPGYQVALARQVREASGMATMAVGLITEPAHAEAILQAGDADMVALARAFLYQPRWGWQAAATLGGSVQAQPAYWRCPPAGFAGIFNNTAVAVR
jgi:NADPH2 dehydrogenase